MKLELQIKKPKFFTISIWMYLSILNQIPCLSGLLSFVMITFWYWYWVGNLFILYKLFHFVAYESESFVVFLSGSNNSRPDCEYNTSWELCTKSWDAGKYTKNSYIIYACIDVNFGTYQVKFMQEVRVVENATNVAPSGNVALYIEVIKTKIHI